MRIFGLKGVKLRRASQAATGCVHRSGIEVCYSGPGESLLNAIFG